MPKPGTPRSLLVIEDELLYLELVVIRAEQIGYEVIAARTVDEALSLLNQLRTVDLTPKSVDAIWIDHFLPEKNGDEFVKELIKVEEWKNIPFFLVSNAVEQEIVNWYLRAGAKQSYPKITNRPENILSSIDLYLQQHPSGDRQPETIHRP